MKKLIVMVVLSFLMCGCFSGPISSEAFMNYAMNKGYQVGQLEQSSKDILTYTEVKGENGEISIDFLEYIDTNSASEAYQKLSSKNQTNSQNIILITSSDNRIEYYENTDFKYNVQIENTILKISCNKAYEDEVREMVKKIGY